MKRLTKEKEKAIAMRKLGMSYSQIRGKLKVSKSTLSSWLANQPLLPERVYELQGGNAQRIEKSRATKLLKRETKLAGVYGFAKRRIGSLSDREIFLAGLFLYWGEGTKAARDIVAFTNTDPDMLKFAVMWLVGLGVPRSKLKAKLHLYKDMDIQKQTEFWSKILGIPTENFRKPYIKDSAFSDLSYKSSFGKGTCCVSYGNTDVHNLVMMSLKRLREIA